MPTTTPGHTPQSIEDAIGNLKAALLILKYRTSANKILSTDEVWSLKKAIAYLEEHLAHHEDVRAILSATRYVNEMERLIKWVERGEDLVWCDRKNSSTYGCVWLAGDCTGVGVVPVKNSLMVALNSALGG